MISTWIMTQLISFMPLALPTDALNSIGRLELQLAEIRGLMNQNIELSKENRAELVKLIDELIAGAEGALVGLGASHDAHDQLVQLNQNGLPPGSVANYDDEFQRRIGRANVADSNAAAELQMKTLQAKRSNQFVAIDAQASVQVWQSLNRISMQLQEMTDLLKTRHSSASTVDLSKFDSFFETPKGGAPITRK